MAADCGSTMPRYSSPSACSRPLEFVGKHGLDLVAIMKRGAGIGNDDLVDVETLEDFRRSIGHKSHANLPRLDDVSLHHLDGEMVNGGARNGNPAAQLGVDTRLGEHADF